MRSIPEPPTIEILLSADDRTRIRNAYYRGVTFDKIRKYLNSQYKRGRWRTAYVRAYREFFEAVANAATYHGQYVSPDPKATF